MTAGNTSVVTGTFTQRGSLRVITSPAVAGTVWVDAVRRNDWGMWTDLSTGAHQVCFGAVGGFTAPACQNVTVNGGALTTVTGEYDIDGPEIVAVHPQPNENAWLLGLVAAREQRLLTQRVMGMVGARGFEPPTSSSRTMRATKLRHAPTECPLRATE